MMKHRKAIAIGLVLGLLTAASVAMAAWLFNSVAGNAGAKTATVAAPTIVALTGAEITDVLLPGQSGPLTLKVTNPNAVPLVLKAVLANGTIGSSATVPCPPSNLTTPGLDVSGLSIAIPASSSTVVVIPGSIVHLDVAAPTGCNGGIVFTVPVLGNFST